MHIVNKTWIIDGPKAAVLHVYLESDGLCGELVDYPLVDPSVDFNPPMAKKAGLAVSQAWFTGSWFDMKLSYEAVPNVPFLVLPRDSTNYLDLRYFGGLKDRSWPDATGKVLLSTMGFEPEKSAGTLILEFKKSRP